MTEDDEKQRSAARDGANYHDLHRRICKFTSDAVYKDEDTTVLNIVARKFDLSEDIRTYNNVSGRPSKRVRKRVR